MTNRRDAVMAVLSKQGRQTYTPAAFFLHFDPQHHSGPAAVERHLEFFRHTEMDFVKVQFELPYPHLPEIQRPGDWAGMPKYGLDFYRGQLEVVEGLVRAAGRDALVVVTLYSPFMLARETAGAPRIEAHIRENPDAVRRGIDIIADSLLGFVRECVRLGVDGFYHSTQGGEAHRFSGTDLFERCIKPTDLRVMREINQACAFNILHICDYHGGYKDLTPFLDYPGHVVNCSLHLGDRIMTPQEVSSLFGRPFMGGMERLGILSTGTPDQVTLAANDVLATASERFILGADCTVLSETPWVNLRAAIAAAHAWKPKA